MDEELKTETLERKARVDEEEREEDGGTVW
jgi:hypothetical protein